MENLGYLIASAVLILAGSFVIGAMFLEQDTRQEKMGFLKGLSLGVLVLLVIFYVAASFILDDWLEVFRLMRII